MLSKRKCVPHQLCPCSVKACLNAGALGTATSAGSSTTGKHFPCPSYQCPHLQSGQIGWECSLNGMTEVVPHPQENLECLQPTVQTEGCSLAPGASLRGPPPFPDLNRRASDQPPLLAKCWPATCEDCIDDIGGGATHGRVGCHCHCHSTEVQFCRQCSVTACQFRVWTGPGCDASPTRTPRKPHVGLESHCLSPTASLPSHCHGTLPPFISITRTTPSDSMSCNTRYGGPTQFGSFLEIGMSIEQPLTQFFWHQRRLGRDVVCPCANPTGSEHCGLSFR